MWCSLLIVLVAVGGSSAFDVFRDCDMSMCDGPAEIAAPGTAPTEEQLKKLCPPVLERLECRKNVIKDCKGKSLEELSTSDNSTVASISTLLLNLQGVIVEVCDEESLLHEGYVSSLACFNEVLEAQPVKCFKEALAIYHDFEESQKLIDMPDNPKEDEEDVHTCMIIPIMVACYTVEVRERCGEMARATMVDILRRLQFVTQLGGMGLCKREQIETLRTTYLEFTEYEGEKKSWFSQVFNSRRK